MRLLVGLVSIGLFTSSCFAAPAAQYTGGLCFTSTSDQCQEFWTTDTCFSVRYAPRNVGSNGPATRLSMFSGTFAIGFALPTGNPIGDVKEVSASKIAIGGYSFPMGFRFISQSPTSPISSTANITFVGTFTNFDEIENCTVNFRGAVTKREF